MDLSYRLQLGWCTLHALSALPEQEFHHRLCQFRLQYLDLNTSSDKSLEYDQGRVGGWFHAENLWGCQRLWFVTKGVPVESES